MRRCRAGRAARDRRPAAVPRCSTGRRRSTGLPRFSAALGGGVDVWIKREDLLPLAFGGNKLRNLEFLVGAALAEGADTLVTSRPALVEPLPADRRRRGAGRARRPPRAQRPAARPSPAPTSASTRCSGATVHVAGDRRAGRARGARRSGSTADLRAAGRRPYVDRRRRERPDRRGRPGARRRWRRSARPRAPASSPRRSSCRRRPAGPTPGSWSGHGSRGSRGPRRRHRGRGPVRRAAPGDRRRSSTASSRWPA